MGKEVIGVDVPVYKSKQHDLMAQILKTATPNDQVLDVELLEQEALLRTIGCLAWSCPNKERLPSPSATSCTINIT